MIITHVKKILAAGCITLLLAGCLTNEAGETNKQTLLGIGGAIGGGVIGNQFGKGRGNVAAIIAGTVIGGALGSNLGASMNKADLLYAKRAEETALENSKVGVPVQWRNPDTGASGVVTPTKTYMSQGTVCREMISTATVGGKTQKVYGTACRQADGSWQQVSN